MEEAQAFKFQSPTQAFEFLKNRQRIERPDLPDANTSRHFELRVHLFGTGCVQCYRKVHKYAKNERTGEVLGHWLEWEFVATEDDPMERIARETRVNHLERAIRGGSMSAGMEKRGKYLVSMPDTHAEMQIAG